MNYKYMEQTVEHESTVDIPETAIAVFVREEYHNVMVCWLEPVHNYYDDIVTDEELDTCEKQEREMKRRSSLPRLKFSGQKNRW